VKVRLDESVERERLLAARLEQASVREKLLKQEVRQAVQDERSQQQQQLSAGLHATDAVLTSAPLDSQTGASQWRGVHWARLGISLTFNPPGGDDLP